MGLASTTTIVTTEKPRAAPGELLTTPIEKESTPERARVARQIQALAVRHNISDTEELARRLKAHWKPEHGPPIAALTIRRLLRQENDASRRTLRRMAEAFGETVDHAFPESEQQQSGETWNIGGATINVDPHGRQLDPKIRALFDFLAAGGNASIGAPVDDKPSPPTKPRKRS